MTIETLKLFKDIATSRSVSRGAALNGISQSAASQQIQEIEHSFQAVFLDRGTRPLTVTEAGKIYLEFCRDVLRRHDEFRAALDEWNGTSEGTVRVASIYSVGLSEMSQLEREFQRRSPESRLEVEYLRPEKVYEAVAADRADLGLVSYAEPTRDITVIPWREEKMVVAVSPRHPLAARSDVTAADLDGVEFIGFDEDLPIQRNVDRFLRDHGALVHTVLHFDNLQMIKEAVAHGSGVSIMPARIMHSDVARGRMIPIPFSGPGLFRPLGIIHRRRKRFHRAAQAFLELLREAPLESGEPVPAVFAEPLQK